MSAIFLLNVDQVQYNTVTVLQHTGYISQ